MKLVTLDCEVYPNYFLAAFKCLKTEKVLTFEIIGKSKSFTDKQVQNLNRLLSSVESFGFNSLNYDIPIIQAALSGYTSEQLFKMSEAIIGENLRGWQICKRMNLRQKDYKHFDIQEPAPGVRVSLKLYGGRLHSKRLQDLPIEPGTLLTKDQIDIIKKYCINDLDTTIDLYNSIKKSMDIRQGMVGKYGYSVMSKSDAQIAELVIKQDLFEINDNFDPYRKSTVKEGDIIKYNPPSFISFKSKLLQDTLEFIKNYDFVVTLEGSTGALKLPKEIKDLKIKIGVTQYQIGVGGIHSKDKKMIVIPKNNQQLIDKDVASYYPQIILNLELYPKHLGYGFLKVFSNIVIERLLAKRNGEKDKNATLKIVINGSFGKLGNKWSILYSPDLMLAVTLTGQLSLLMLIEELEQNGISVMSANTDGFVSLVDNDKYNLYEEICQDWEVKTGFTLEDNFYKGLYSRDVNNYLAITNYGYKGKGIFSLGELSKNPQFEISIEAVINFLTDNKPLRHTIRECRDLTKFLSVRTVAGGATWKGEYLGKVVRWIYSKEGETIYYAKNGNKVPKSDGSKPIMELGNFPKCIDYDRYISEAESILKDIGYKITKI